MEPSAAAITRMGMLTAYLMLNTNAEGLKPGGWIIMNGATSVVAHFLAQFARSKQLNVISVVRDRPDAADVAQTLQDHGADVVLTDKNVMNATGLQGKRIMLGFDAVFGSGGNRLIDTLSPGATYVSYGSLGGLGPGTEILISQQSILVRRITFKAFQLSAALAALTDGEVSDLCAWLSGELKEGRLTTPMLEHVQWALEDPDEKTLKAAVQKASKGILGQHKCVFIFS